MHSEDPSWRTQLLEYLGAKRYRRADRLVQLLADQEPALRKELRRVAKGVARDTSRKRGKAASKARTRQSAQVLELTAGLGEPASLTKSNLHPFRLKVKELRDTLRVAGGTPDSRFAGTLGQCKNAIGEWHDWEELIAAAEKTLDHGPPCPLLQELKTISKQKFDSALTIAEKLRTDYGRPQTGIASTNRTQPRGSKSKQTALPAAQIP